MAEMKEERKEELGSEKQENESQNNDFVSVESTKKRKEFKWTEKRLEGFNKMRKALEEKNIITKQLKAEKAKSEKDEIKRRVKAIMQKQQDDAAVSVGVDSKTKKKSKVIASSSDSNNSSSEDEVSRPKKKSSSSSKAKKETLPPKKDKRKKKRPVEVDSESSNSSSEGDSQSEDDKEERAVLSARQRQDYEKGKRNVGKTPKQSTYVNAMDQFILL